MVDENIVKEPTEQQLEAKGRMVTAMEEITKIQEKYQVSIVINTKYTKEGLLAFMSVVDIKQPETAETVADKIN